MRFTGKHVSVTRIGSLLTFTIITDNFYFTVARSLKTDILQNNIADVSYCSSTILCHINQVSLGTRHDHQSHHPPISADGCWVKNQPIKLRECIPGPLCPFLAARLKLACMIFIGLLDKVIHGFVCGIVEVR